MVKQVDVTPDLDSYKTPRNFYSPGPTLRRKNIFSEAPRGDSPEKKFLFRSFGIKIFSPESGSGRSGDLWAGRTPSLDHGFSIAPVVIDRLDASFEVSNTLVDSRTRLLPNFD